MYSRSYLSAWPYKEHLELIDLFKLIFFFTSLCVWWSLLKSSSGFSVACAEWPLFKLVLLGYADLQCCASFSVQWSESVIQDICCCSVAQSCPTLCNPMDCSKPGFPVFYCLWSLFKLMSIESEMPSNHLTLCRPLLLLPSVFPSIRVFSNELALSSRWPKYWSFSFDINPFNKYPELLSFRIDWFDFLAVQGTLKSLLQHHSLKASVLWYSAFIMVKFSYLYMTIGKPIALIHSFLDSFPYRSLRSI